ncbi:MAG: hypothetical protein KatS3mg053_1547 [Candidatus Roseilinea sp.]|nr:MAG: hypothetical protein KatS3mg053_1547 [Candidatus Roseilinea sp.]
MYFRRPPHLAAWSQRLATRKVAQIESNGEQAVCKVVPVRAREAMRGRHQPGQQVVRLGEYGHLLLWHILFLNCSTE